MWQLFSFALDFLSVEVKNNARSFEYPFIIRAVNTVDAMTAEIEHPDWNLLDKITRRTIEEIAGINRVCYNLSPKPLGTTEWE